MNSIKKIASSIRTFLAVVVRPVSKNKDDARREYILNILLICSFALSASACLITFFEDIVLKMVRQGDTPLPLLIISVLYLSGLWLSKKGHSKIVSFLLIGLYFLLASQALYNWGPDMPVGLLMYSLLIVMAGILISARFGFILAIGMSCYLTLLIHMYEHSLISFHINWKSGTVNLVDAIVFSIFLLTIATVSWLFNHESEKTLHRARESERALKRERDLLEQKVEEKTRELKRVQTEKIAQIYRFAEVGKMAFGFMHDLASAVSLVSLNLEEMEKVQKGQPVMKEVREMLRRANLGTERLEQYVSAARKQINNRQTKEIFVLNDEIKQVIQIVEYKAKTEQVALHLIAKEEVELMGSPIKFHQLVTNLIVNAIESYTGITQKNKSVVIELKTDKSQMELRVSDIGSGISTTNQEHIFTPLFTTKDDQHGSGMGLSMSRDIVVKDFGGTIRVVSEVGKGSSFIVTIPRRIKHSRK